MTSRSDCEPLPTPTLSPFTRVPLSVSVFHCRRVVCACSAGAVGSFSNKPLSPKPTAVAPTYTYALMALLTVTLSRSNEKWRHAPSWGTVVHFPIHETLQLFATKTYSLQTALSMDALNKPGPNTAISITVLNGLLPHQLEASSRPHQLVLSVTYITRLSNSKR